MNLQDLNELKDSSFSEERGYLSQELRRAIEEPDTSEQTKRSNRRKSTKRIYSILGSAGFDVRVFENKTAKNLLNISHLLIIGALFSRYRIGVKFFVFNLALLTIRFNYLEWRLKEFAMVRYALMHDDLMSRELKILLNYYAPYSAFYSEFRKTLEQK